MLVYDIFSNSNWACPPSGQKPAFLNTKDNAEQIGNHIRRKFVEQGDDKPGNSRKTLKKAEVNI